MKITDGLEMLELKTNMMGRTSAFFPTLIWDSQSAILVDTGYPGMLPQLREAVDQTGVGISRLNRIIITHHDMDHIGNLASILQEPGGQIRVMAYREEIPYINGEKRPLKLAQFEDNLDALTEDQRAVYERMKAGFENGFAPVDQSLSDGQELPFCGGITVIHTPGHTIGHISLYLRHSKILISKSSFIG